MRGALLVLRAHANSRHARCTGCAFRLRTFMALASLLLSAGPSCVGFTDPLLVLRLQLLAASLCVRQQAAQQEVFGLELLYPTSCAVGGLASRAARAGLMKFRAWQLAGLVRQELHRQQVRHCATTTCAEIGESSDNTHEELSYGTSLAYASRACGRVGTPPRIRGEPVAHTVSSRDRPPWWTLGALAAQQAAQPKTNLLEFSPLG